MEILIRFARCQTPRSSRNTGLHILKENPASCMLTHFSPTASTGLCHCHPCSFNRDTEKGTLLALSSGENELSNPQSVSRSTETPSQRAHVSCMSLQTSFDTWQTFPSLFLIFSCALLSGEAVPGIGCDPGDCVRSARLLRFVGTCLYTAGHRSSRSCSRRWDPRGPPWMEGTGPRLPADGDRAPAPCAPFLTCRRGPHGFWDESPRLLVGLPAL